MDSSKKKHLLTDVLLAGSILLIALVVWLWSSSAGKNGAYVIVTVSGTEIARYPLNVNADYALNGGTNHLVIEDGCAYLDYADCPDKLCVKQGKIRHGGQSLVCLPNKLAVRVVSDDGGVDIVP